MAKPWHEYQEEAATFFRSLGLDAQTNVTVQGARTGHDVDVVVKSFPIGISVTWLVECKHWQTRVCKQHILALRTIVSEVGADRGILLSESGFQSGTIEASRLTNVQATSLADLRKTASVEIMTVRLRELGDRLEACSKRYWDIPKQERKDCGLRPDVDGAGYSGRTVIELAGDLLLKAFRGAYPIAPATLTALGMAGFNRQFARTEEVLAAVQPAISELEERLTMCEARRQHKGS